MVSKISNWETSKTKHHKVHFMKIQNTIKKLKIVKNKNKNPPRWKIKHQWWSSFVSLNATTMSSSYNIISGKKLIDVCFHSNMKSPFYPSLLVLSLDSWGSEMSTEEPTVLYGDNGHSPGSNQAAHSMHCNYVSPSRL